MPVFFFPFHFQLNNASTMNITCESILAFGTEKKIMQNIEIKNYIYLFTYLLYGQKLYLGD